MLIIAISVIATGLFLLFLGVWILLHLPEIPTRMDESGRRYQVKECTMMRCELAKP